jgi:maltose/moltooligosaccharide transporter
MGIYMGVFNLFIVIPQVVMSFIMPPLITNVIGNDPVRIVMIGGASLLIAALSVFIVDDTQKRVPLRSVLRADEHERLTTVGTAQPVPSTGLIDEE